MATLPTKEPKQRHRNRSVKNNQQSDAAAAIVEPVDKESKLRVASIVGGSLSSLPVIFSHDSRYVFCAEAASIKIMSCWTGDVVRTMTPTALDTAESTIGFSIIGMHLNPHNRFQLLSMTANGLLCIWDVEDGTLLEEIQLPFNAVARFAIDPKRPNHIYLQQNQDEELQALYRVDLAHVQSKRLIYKSKQRGISNFDVAKSGNFLALLSGSKIQIHNVAADDESPQINSLMHSRELKTVRFHPSEVSIAFGDVRGEIELWHNFQTQSDAAPTLAKMHWHAHQVHALQFTPDGHYLISGGEEGVLVLWQLETGHKQFLPRLGSPILHAVVSHDDQLFALSLRENSVRVINSASLQLMTSIHGLKYGQSTRDVKHPMLQQANGGLTMDRNDNLVLAGVPGSLQFWNLDTSKHVLEVDVTARSRVYRTDRGVVATSHVQHVAFSPDGEWMATIDSRNKANEDLDRVKSLAETYLKFWRFNQYTNRYELTTRIDQPHRGKINRLVFHPKGVPQVRENGEVSMLPMVATASDDFSFKLWQMSITPVKPSIQQQQQFPNAPERFEFSWYCRSTGVWRDMPVTDLSFSHDGSVLAASFGHLVTLWHPMLLTMQGVLAHPPSSSLIRSLAFMHSSTKERCAGGHYLAASTKDGFYVWNVLSGALRTMARMPVKHLAVDADQERFLVTAPGRQGTDKGHFLFSLTPTSAKKMTMEAFIAGDVKAVMPIKSSVVYMNEQYDLVTLAAESDSPAPVSQDGQEGMSEAPKGMLTSIFGSSVQKASEAKLSVKPAADLSLFEAASHVIPPVSKLFDSFMTALLAPCPLQKEDNIDSNEAEEQAGEPMQIDDDVWVTSVPSSPWVLPQISLQSNSHHASTKAARTGASQHEEGLMRDLEAYFSSKMSLIEARVDAVGR